MSESHRISDKVGWPGGRVSETVREEWDSRVTTLVRLMIAYGDHVSGWCSMGGDEVLAMARELYGEALVREAREFGFDDLLEVARKGVLENEA